MRLHRPSVCPVRALNSKKMQRRKQNWYELFLWQDRRSNRCANFPIFSSDYPISRSPEFNNLSQGLWSKAVYTQSREGGGHPPAIIVIVSAIIIVECRCISYALLGKP